MASNLVLCVLDKLQTLPLGFCAFPHVKHTTVSLMKCEAWKLGLSKKRLFTSYVEKNGIEQVRQVLAPGLP